MTLTVEPGCYIRAADDVPRALWNIGVRIEDNALVTTGGCEILTDAAPISIDDIEALMATARLMLPVAIVGGGPVGLSLALLLRQAGIGCEVFDARPAGAGFGDRRVLALSHGTRQIFQRLDTWTAIGAAPIADHPRLAARASRPHMIRAEDRRAGARLRREAGRVASSAGKPALPPA
jgi:hypothetical protein